MDSRLKALAAWRSRESMARTARTNGTDSSCPDHVDGPGGRPYVKKAVRPIQSSPLSHHETGHTCPGHCTARGGPGLVARIKMVVDMGAPQKESMETGTPPLPWSSTSRPKECPFCASWRPAEGPRKPRRPLGASTGEIAPERL